MLTLLKYSYCPVLLKALNENEDDDSIQESATDVLEDIGTEAAVEALLQRLNNEDPLVRQGAIIALGNIGTKPAQSFERSKLSKLS
jgi:HEAT repeat protein